MPDNPYEPPQGEPRPRGASSKQVGPLRLLVLVLIGALVAFGLVGLWMQSAKWGW